MMSVGLATMESEAPRFEPADAPSSIVVRRWNPGETVVLAEREPFRHRGLIPFAWVVLGAGIVLAIARVIAPGAVAGLGINDARPLALALTGAIMLGIGLLNRAASGRRTARIDWSRREIRVRRSLRTTTLPFSAVTGIDLVRVRHERRKVFGVPDAKPFFAVVARLANNEERVLVRTDPIRHEDEARASMEVLSATLAAALGVSYRFRRERL